MDLLNLVNLYLLLHPLLLLHLVDLLDLGGQLDQELKGLLEN